MAAVLGRLSAIGLGVLELVLAAVTLLRIVVIVGVALVARILAFPSACVATCLCCGQQLQRQGAEQGAAGRRGRATVTTARDGEPEFHQEGSAHGMTHLSSQADSCKREIDAQVSQSGATLARCQTWSHNQFLFDQKGDCSEWSDALRGPACAPCRECRPRAVPARGSSSGGQDCPARATCGAHEDGHTSPAVVLSSMHSRSTPATLSLQLCLAVDLARGTCLSNPCTHAATPAGDAAPGSTDGAAQGAPHSWAAVEELQQELEEERSAAEEAAAEALRMITRLQSEKAALAAQLRQAAQREQEAALQHGALVDALEAAVAQLEQERSARHRERRHHRARLEAHGARWQPGCAHLALLDGWREGGVVPVQVQPVLLGGLHGGRERGAPGLLLATAVEDAQWPRRTVEEGAPFQEVNEGGPEGRLHLGGHKLIASAAVEEEGDGDPPAQQTAHDGADRQGEALQNVGNLIDVPPELGGQRGNADKGLVRKEGGSGSGVLHRHVFLVSHPVADEGPDQEGLGIAELEQEAGDGGGEERSPLQAGAGTVCLAAAEGASQRDCSPDSSRLHVGGSAKGEEEAATEESPEQEAAQASRSEVGGQGESSDCTDRERCGKWGKTGDAEYGLSRRGGNPVGLSGKDVSEPESNCRLSSGGHEARQSTPQKLHGICADMSREGASDDRARETAYALDRTSEARVLQEQQKNLGGGHSPARSESTAAESTRRKQQTVEVTGSGGSLGAAGGAVSGELAGKLASRRKWEQTWEEKGRHLWSSPSVAIKERPARGGVRRSLFGEERETDQDSTTQNAENIEDPHDFAERIERSSRPGNALTATSARKPEIVSLPTQPPTPNPLSTELARKLASRRKWEVSSEVTGSST